MAVGEKEVVVTSAGTPVPLSDESESVNHFTIRRTRGIFQANKGHQQITGNDAARNGDRMGVDVTVSGRCCGCLNYWMSHYRSSLRMMVAVPRTGS